MQLKETRSFRINDVFIVKYGNEKTLCPITDICGNHLKYGPTARQWISLKEFNEIAIEKYGQRRRFLGFLWWRTVKVRQPIVEDSDGSQEG